MRPTHFFCFEVPPTERDVEDIVSSYGQDVLIGGEVCARDDFEFNGFMDAAVYSGAMMHVEEIGPEWSGGGLIEIRHALSYYNALGFYSIAFDMSYGVTCTDYVARIEAIQKIIATEDFEIRLMLPGLSTSRMHAINCAIETGRIDRDTLSDFAWVGRLSDFSSVGHYAARFNITPAERGNVYALPNMAMED